MSGIKKWSTPIKRLLDIINFITFAGCPVAIVYQVWFHFCFVWALKPDWNALCRPEDLHYIMPSTIHVFTNFTLPFRDKICISPKGGEDASHKRQMPCGHVPRNWKKCLKTTGRHLLSDTFVSNAIHIIVDNQAHYNLIGINYYLSVTNI